MDQQRTMGKAKCKTSVNGRELQPLRKLPKTIVVVGGHSKWIAKMKGVLPELTYLQKEVHWHPCIIQRASEIWVNTSYNSHVLYSRVISIARKYNIPVFYLHTLSIVESVRAIRSGHPE